MNHYLKPYETFVNFYFDNYTRSISLWNLNLLFQICLHYDNMCNVLRTKASKTPLNLPKPYDKMWLSITKLIDTFHVKNHVRKECQTTLHPRNFSTVHPELSYRNTQVGEQTFIYLGRFAKMFSSMTKRHFNFHFHRLVLARNDYISRWNKFKRPPLVTGLRYWNV